MGNYFPTSGQDQRAWVVQFLAQLNNYSTTLGVSGAEVTELTNTGGAATGAIDNLLRNPTILTVPWPVEFNRSRNFRLHFGPSCGA